MSRFDAESDVLGGCLLAPQAYWQCADLLTREDFASHAHSELWQAISDLARAGKPIDVFTVGDHNPAIAQLAVACANETPGTSNIRAYAEAVQRDATIRRVRVAGTRIAKLADKDALTEAQRILGACAPRMASSIRAAKDFLRESTQRMIERFSATEVLTGIPTSIEKLDEMLSGWQRGDLIVIAARPSVGKTALAVQSALHAAMAGHPGLFLSMEMSGSQLTDRMIAHLARVDGQAIRQPKTLDESDWPRITQAGEVIATIPLSIDDTSALTLEGLSARVRQANATQRLGWIAIDYLTQMEPPKANRGDEAIQIITRGLKKIAKDLDVPVILLSQLNRAGDARPTLTTLRESGAIEQDADVVILLHRPDPTNPALIEAIVAKQRNGPIGSAWLHFDRPTQWFTPTDERPPVADAKPQRRGFPTKPDRIWGEAAA